MFLVYTETYAIYSSFILCSIGFLRYTLRSTSFKISSINLYDNVSYFSIEEVGRSHDRDTDEENGPPLIPVERHNREKCL